MPLRLLADLRVVEIASGTTEFAGHLLAGLGAEVLLVEPPGGAETRARRPFAAARDPSRRSIPFLARNHGKRSIVLEPADAGDRERLTALVATAEVLLAPHGSPFDPLPAPGARCTQVVVRDDEGIGAASVTAFAASGGLAASGWPDRAPCNSPSWLAQDSAGTYAACFALVGAWLVRRGAPAPRFEVPLREAAIAGLTPWTRAMRSYAAAANAPARPARLGPSLHPYLPAADGYVRAPVPTPAQFDALVELVGGPDELRRPPWTERAFRTQNIDALVMLIEDRTRARTRADLVDGGQRLGLTITPVLTPAEVMADAHVRARGLFVEVDDPDLGRVPLMREAVRLPLEPAPPPPVPAPALDADAALAARAAARASAATATAARRRVAGGAGAPPRALAPFAGLRVLNLGVGAVVPELGALLALLGAEVIKVESRKRLEFMRMTSVNEAATFNQGGMAMRSLAVDMSSSEGRAVVHALVPRCDVVMENMRPGIVARWGLDYASVRALRPDVIYLASSGLGRGGPYSHYQTYGPNLQSFAGLTWLWAHPDDPYAVGTSLNHPDHIAGKHAASAVIAALMRRDRTGEGAFLEAAQCEVAAELIADRFLEEALTPGGARPLGNRSRDAAPHGVYPCAGVDRWIALAATSDEEWSRLAALIDTEWARAPALTATDARLAAADAIDARLAAWTSPQAVESLEAALRAAGVPAARVVTGDDMVAAAADHEQGIFGPISHPTAGLHWYTGVPVRCDGARVPLRHAPLLGEHTEYVLLDLLGLDRARVDALIASGAVGE